MNCAFRKALDHIQICGGASRVEAQQRKWIAAQSSILSAGPLKVCCSLNETKTTTHFLCSESFVHRTIKYKFQLDLQSRTYSMENLSPSPQVSIGSSQRSEVRDLPYSSIVESRCRRRQVVPVNARASHSTPPSSGARSTEAQHGVSALFCLPN